jgi:5'-methylthioadenosine phosphorylase
MYLTILYDLISLTSYALIATSTDYDAWRVGEAPVTVAEVFKTLQDNAATSGRVAAAIIEHVHDVVEKQTVLTNSVGGMKYSIVTAPAHQSEEDRKKLSFILPYFSN